MLDNVTEWPKEFNRKEETFYLSVKNTFGTELSDTQKNMVRYAYLLGRLDHTMEQEYRHVCSREYIYKLMNETPRGI